MIQKCKDYRSNECKEQDSPKRKMQKPEDKRPKESIIRKSIESDKERRKKGSRVPWGERESQNEETS